MTKRNSQANTVVVPAAEAHVAAGKAVAAQAAAAVSAEVVAEVQVAEVVAEKPPVTVTVVAEPMVALAAPAPMAMVAEPATGEPSAQDASDAPMQDDGDTPVDVTPYIIGGALLAGGILALALSSGDEEAAPTPTPTPPPTNAVTFSSATTASVAENAPISTTVIDVNATAAASGGAIVYTLGGTDASFFAIDAATGVVTLRNSANFEARSTYSITVTASSAAAGTTPAATATQTIAITITNVNEQPTFASATATVSVPENIPTTQVVFTASATDPDAVPGATTPAAGSVITYTITGTDAASFQINPQTGAVTFRQSPDFETKSSYTFTVTATDNATPSLNSSQTVTVNVTDVAEGPVFTSPATVTVAENAATSTVVFDANATGATSFALSGPDAAAFDFNTATGVATLRTSANFEAKAVYNVTVSATGPTGTSTQAITVNVTNVNEAPSFASAVRTATFAENVAAGTVVVAAGSATDPDGTAAPNTLTYTLTGADAASFAVNAQTGAVTFVASPNFEAKSSYSFNLVATDQGGLSATQANTITITDVNEAPVFAGGATRTVSVPENTTAVIAAGSATDPDTGATLTYSLTGADAALFNVNPQTGAVTFRTAPDFEATPPRNTLSFNLVASDGTNSVSQAVTVNVTDVAVEGVRIDGPGISATAPLTYDAANGNVTFLESGAAGNVSTITNFTSGDIIQTDVATSSYSFSSSGTTLIVSFNNGGTVTRIELPNSISANAFVFNEASAEQAVGFDFFRSSTPAAPPATGGLDAGGNTLTTVNAGTAANTYTDDASRPSNVVITNFASDDRIVATNAAAGSYSFSSSGDDLVISFNNNGTLNRIVLQDVANPNVFVFDETSAEQAVGFDFFRYG